MTTAPASAIAPWADAAGRRRLHELESRHREESAADVAAAVSGVLDAHHQRIGTDGLVLYAGTNVLSPAVRAAHDTDLSTRPALGWPGGKLQTGVQEIEALEVIATTQVARAMRAAHAEVRFLTATMANLALYSAFTQPGDTIAVLSPEAGGHASHHAHATAGIRGLKVTYLPYNPVDFDVDETVLDVFLTAHRPKLILVGGSVTLFPHRLTVLRAAADRIGALLAYDASHTAGLIAAGYFQDPLAEGAHVVTFSTYKTFAGPAGGAAVTNDPELAQAISHAAYPVMSSNYDPARLGPLAVAAAEAVEQQPSWAGPTITTAQRLGHHLAAHGYAVLGAHRGYTRTHQVVLDATALGGGTPAVGRLAAHGIYAGTCRLPWQTPDGPAQGIRLGTQEIVRRGADTATMAHIAAAVHHALINTVAPSTDRAAELRAALGRDLWNTHQPGTDQPGTDQHRRTIRRIT
ncbi:DegT/DnrJ/EryC1/StrS family aminotransferase [Streptomyces spinoverrucosus]|uniref:DegT/DnrJ/EryC1/StrS family aminotransferase n=1 Tax=Streptomyces spinoverrucosus TaxID=284043 RepID=UPI0018C44030|nr:DegT/DnrJ/EryC1/StrS family aminotransferase [Streptomyces spinoverrucosus]MBG0851392.1 DegT/DnrJ/EryC1/StrS family aminotransferase [Streptomyces spinoverrucosus]